VSEHDDLPVHAKERLADMRKRRLFTSDLSVSEFVLVREAGFDHVRVPMRISSHADARAPYRIEGRFLKRMDWVIDQALSNERYQGIVPLEGGSLAEAVEHFFVQSEQIPSLVRVAVDDQGEIAGGILLQHLPEGEEGRERLHTRLDHPEWEHVRVIGQTIKGGELADPGLPLETLLWHLFHEEDEVRLLSTVPLARGCRCSLEYVRGVIGRFSPEEQAEMVDDKGFISVDCEFCSRVFPIRPDELQI